jgi:hypothetical protein
LLGGIDCAETIICASPPAMTISPDKDNAMKIEIVLLFIIVTVWFLLSSSLRGIPIFAASEYVI